MLIFVKDSLKDNLKNLDQSINKTGAMGAFGNKGNLAFRFNYFDTSFAIVNCHLSSDLEKKDERDKWENEKERKKAKIIEQ